MFSPLAVANYFIVKGLAEGEPLTPMKLQKLVYYAHGYHLASQDKPLISDPVEAWQWGPVIPRIYHAFKKWGNNPIPQPLVTPATQNGMALLFGPTDETKKVLDLVYSVYGGLTAAQLSNMTHKEGTPWAKTYEEYVMHKDIPNDVIKDYFVKLLQTQRDRRTAHENTI